MKFTSIKLLDFGPFEGTEELDFSTSLKKPITIVHANNGTGKTTLLNAFLWGLFGVYHVQKKEIPNHHAVSQIGIGDVLKVSVELKFTHEKRKYTIARYGNFKKKSDIEVEHLNDNISIVYIDENGGTDSPPNLDTFIDQNILPEALKDFFFFHGENAKILTLPENVSSAIKNIMGITLLERAEKHLKKAKRYFTKQIDLNAEGSLKEVNQNIESIESELAKILTLISQNEKLISTNKIHKTEIESKLLDNKLTESLQSTLNQHQNSRDSLLSEKKNFELSSKNIISTSAYMILISKIIDDNIVLLNDKRKRGEIPGKIRKVLINDLLAMGECICGSQLDEKSINILESIRDKAISQKFENRVAELTNQLTSMKERGNSVSDNLDGNISGLIRIQERLDSLNGLISDIESKLDDKEFESVSDLRDKIKEIEKENESKLVENTRFISNSNNLQNNELKDLKTDREKLIKLDNRQETNKKREDVAEEAMVYYQNLLEQINDKVRSELTSIFSETYNRIMVSDFEVLINHAFQVEIKKRTDGRVPIESEGQKRVKSLSFIGSLVSLAEKYFSSKNTFLKGGIFPLVIDSPFGELDPNYQSMISKNIASLADQVVLFVSPSQWTQSVKNELDQFVGKHVHLKYYTTKSKEEFLQNNANLKLIGDIEFNSLREKTEIN